MRLSLLLVAVVALAACSSYRPEKSQRIPPEAARSLLVDRNWIDRMPQNHRDPLHVFRFTPSMGGGVFQDRTLFKGTFELFTFEATGDELRFSMPETREKLRTRYKIESVKGPAPFDLKLTLETSPRGPAVYYGVRAETDRTGAALETRLAPLRDAR